MADKKENEMQKTIIAAFLRCMDNEGNSKLITPDNILKDTVSDRLFFDYSSNEVLNSLVIPGTYSHGASIIGTNGGHGLLLVLKANKYIVQLDFISSGKIIYRFSADGGASWLSWKYLTFT